MLLLSVQTKLCLCPSFLTHIYHVAWRVSFRVTSEQPVAQTSFRLFKIWRTQECQLEINWDKVKLRFLLIHTWCQIVDIPYPYTCMYTSRSIIDRYTCISLFLYSSHAKQKEANILVYIHCTTIPSLDLHYIISFLCDHYMQQQQLIELIRQRQLEKALDFAQLHLSERAEEGDDVSIRCHFLPILHVSVVVCIYNTDTWSIYLMWRSAKWYNTIVLGGISRIRENVSPACFWWSDNITFWRPLTNSSSLQSKLRICWG